METRALLLSVVEEAIQLRAAKDGHSLATYNADDDPEKYVASLLTGLRHWCHARNINWHEELERSLACFTQHLGLPQEPPAFSELACPACGHRGSFYTELTEVVLREPNGEVLPGDEPPQWGDSAWCSCPECAHAAQVCEFRAAATPAGPD